MLIIDSRVEFLAHFELGVFFGQLLLKFLLLRDQLTLQCLLLLLELLRIQLLAIGDRLFVGSLRLQLFQWILDIILQVLHQ